MTTEEEVITAAGGREIARRAIEQRVRGGTLQLFYVLIAMYNATRFSTGRNHHHHYHHRRRERGSKSTAAIVGLCKREKHCHWTTPREERERARERERENRCGQESKQERGREKESTAIGLLMVPSSSVQ